MVAQGVGERGHLLECGADCLGEDEGRVEALQGEVGLLLLGVREDAVHARGDGAEIALLEPTQAGESLLAMPAGISERLRAQIRERGTRPITVDVSEFLKKGGGSVKCMIGDLGPVPD